MLKKADKPALARRMTRQRLVIINMLRQTDEHPTAEMVYEEVRRKLPGISLGTVYRNLQLLVEQGQALELAVSGGSSRYDANCLPHSHFFCQRCKKVYDIPAYEVRLPDELKKNIPGTLLSQRTDFFGVCNDCRKKAGPRD